MTAKEPTAADVLTELQVMRREVRADLAELRLDWADRWSRTNERLDDISRHLSVLIDMVAEFRAEYNAHVHPHRHGEDGEVAA
jgi:hypothetical protein